MYDQGCRARLRILASCEVARVMAARPGTPAGMDEDRRPVPGAGPHPRGSVPARGLVHGTRRVDRPPASAGAADLRSVIQFRAAAAAAADPWAPPRRLTTRPHPTSAGT